MSCQIPGCVFHSEKNGYCIRHKFMTSSSSEVAVKENKPRKEIPKRSEKLKDEMKEYKKEVKIFLSRPENEMCLIQSPVCTKKATCVHHKKRRGKNLRNEKYQEPACEPCNLYVEEHPKWAYENGHLISIHKPE